MNHWSDKHCPDYDANMMDFAEDATPIEACEEYKNFVNGDIAENATTVRMEELTHNSGTDMFGVDRGYGLNAQVLAEISVKQRWNLWFILEGAPFRDERALFTDTFSAPMYKKDTQTYMRVGTTYKF
jgi:hypothetical protein